MAAQDEQHLVVLERDGWEALASGEAREFYDRLLASGAVMVLPFGVMERDDAIESMAQAPPWTSYRLDEMTVHSLGDAMAVVAYRVRAHRDGADAYEAMLTSTYVWSGGDWRMVLHQHSPTAGGTPP